MNNPLFSLKNILKKRSIGYRIAQVTKKDGEKLTIKTETGVALLVWGIADLFDWVITKDNQILGKIGIKDTQTVYIP